MYSFNKYLLSVLRVPGIVVRTGNIIIKKDGGGNEETPFLNILPLLSPPFQSSALPGYLKESVSATPPPGFKKLWLIFE